MLDKDLRKKMEQIRVMTRKKITTSFAGDYQSAFKGRGMEFEEVRPYQPGDETRFIDWNVTARSGEPWIKLFREERELTMFLMVDLSPSGQFSSGDKTKNEMAAELCAMLAFTAISNNDRVGLGVFTNEMENVIHPGKGSRHVLHLIREVLTHKPEGTGTSIRKALEFSSTILHRRSILILISDFWDLDYEKALGYAGEKHDLVCIQLQDKRELTPPAKGLVLLRDPETGEKHYLDYSDKETRTRWVSSFKERQQRLENLMRKKGADLLILNPDEDWIGDLTRFFIARSHRI
jgi:uncharacterized protein (DUF58 family)